MKAVLLALLFFFQSHHRIRGYIFEICNHNATRLNCGETKRIHIKFAYHLGVNRAEKTLHILEQCNGHHSCNLSDPTLESGKCIQGVYSCWHSEIPILEIKTSSTVRRESSYFLGGWTHIFLMSENYLKGQYMDAENIYCSLRFLEESKDTYENSKLHIRALEFTPFSNLDKFCLRMQNLTKPVICSGSWKIETRYRYYYTKDGWHFHLTLDDTSFPVPQVRFWIYVAVSSERNIQLECTSEPASPSKSTKKTPDHESTTISIEKSPNAVSAGTWTKKPMLPVIAVTSSLCVVFAVAFACLLVKFRRLSKKVQQPAVMPAKPEDQLVYDEINENAACQASHLPSTPVDEDGYLVALPSVKAKWSKRKP